MQFLLHGEEFRAIWRNRLYSLLLAKTFHVVSNWFIDRTHGCG
jgi:hypothetical protein